MLISDAPTKRKTAVNKWLEKAKRSIYQDSPPGNRTTLAKIHRVIKVILGNERYAEIMIERADLMEQYNEQRQSEKAGLVYVIWSPRHIYIGKTIHFRQRLYEHMTSVKTATSKTEGSQDIHRAIRRELTSEEWFMLPIRAYNSEYKALACESKLQASLRTFKACKNVQKSHCFQHWEIEVPCLQKALATKSQRNRPRKRSNPPSRIPDKFLVTPLKVASERIKAMTLEETRTLLAHPDEYTQVGYITLLKRIALPYEKLVYEKLEHARECVFPILVLMCLAFVVLPHNIKLRTALRKIRYHCLKRGVPSITSISLTTRYAYERAYLNQMRQMILTSSHAEVQWCLNRTKWSIRTTTKKRLLELATTCRKALKYGPPPEKPPPNSHIVSKEAPEAILQLHDMNSPMPAIPIIPRAVLRESAKLLRSTRRNLTFPPDMRPFINFCHDLALQETQDWRAANLISVCKNTRSVITPDDKHRHMAYLLPATSYRGRAWNAMDDGTFVRTDLTEDEAIEKIKNSAESVKPPLKIPRTYFTIKQKCVRPCQSPQCSIEKAILVVNTCKKAHPHKCMRRIISTSGCYDKPEEKQQKADGLAIRNAVYANWCTLACIPCEQSIHQAYQKVHSCSNRKCVACETPMSVPNIMTFDATSFFETVDEMQFIEAADELESLAPHVQTPIQRTKEIIKHHRFVKLMGVIWEMVAGKGSPIGMRCSGTASLVTMGYDENRHYPYVWSRNWISGLRYEDDLLVFANLCKKCLEKVVAFAYRHPMEIEAQAQHGNPISWTSFEISQDAHTGSIKTRTLLKEGWEGKVRPYDQSDWLYQKAYYQSMCHVGRVVREHKRKGYPKALLRKWFHKRHPRGSWKDLDMDLSD